jgi:hypothetical protein
MGSTSQGLGHKSSTKHATISGVADVKLKKNGAPLQQLARTDSMEYERVCAACGDTGPNALARVVKDRPVAMSRAVSRELNWVSEGHWKQLLKAG